MKKFLLHFLCLFLLSSIIQAQTPTKYWVQFKDKQGSTYSIDRPQEFLSLKAIENRKTFNISITESDLPVNEHYIQSVMALDSNMILFTKSKWLNGITVYSEKDSMLQEIAKLPNVLYCEITNISKTHEEKGLASYTYSYAKPNFTVQPNNTFDYGQSLKQLKVNNVHWLHRLGFTGAGVAMAVTDGGFLNVDTLRYFAKLREEGRLQGARNFVEPHASPFRKDNHGTMVLSCIAANVPGELVGSAPNALIYLAKTEDGRSETKIEEDNWVAGVEWADSLGCLILNASLGYSQFDDTVAQPRHYSDLTGKVSRASQAATIAASKGMIVCNSAGNSGNSKWKYISCPADADDILTIGAVNVDRKKAGFSSFGPTADGRVKPDACAVGESTIIGNQRSQTVPANGTSFSSPLLSGMVACIREAFPQKSNFEIMDAIRQSGDLYTKPTVGLGYGITDFMKVYNLLLQTNTGNNQSLTIDFDTYIYNGTEFIARIVSTQEQTITISGLLRGGEKATTKTYTLNKGENVLSIKMPKLNKKAEYVIIDLSISGENVAYRYVIGGEVK